MISKTLLANKQIRKVVKERIKNKDFNILIYFENDKKLGAFFAIEHLLTKKQKLKLFKEAWISAEFNYMYIDKCKRFFKEYGKDLMNEEEKCYLNNLPEKITIYRGTKVLPKEDHGISWTIDKKIAEMFIYGLRFKYFELINGRKTPFKETLLEKQINKKDICCYISDRNEQEFIYLGA